MTSTNSTAPRKRVKILAVDELSLLRYAAQQWAQATVDQRLAELGRFYKHFGGTPQNADRMLPLVAHDRSVVAGWCALCHADFAAAAAQDAKFSKSMWSANWWHAHEVVVQLGAADYRWMSQVALQDVRLH